MKYRLFFILLFVSLFFVAFPHMHTLHAWNPIMDNNIIEADLTEALENDGVSINPMQALWITGMPTHLGQMITGDYPPAYLAKHPGTVGLIPQVTNLNIAMLHNQPVGLGLWIADTGRSLGFLPKQALAQGVGFSGLEPILSIWKIFRNIAYLMLSLALIIVGFMVMFRRKIDPQTVVTIQDALPRVIIALILITFSYAIVAILVDVLYIVLLLVYGVFQTGNLLPTTRSTTGLLGTPTTNYITQDVFLNGSVTDAVGVIFPNNFADFGALVERIMGTSITTWGAAVGAGAGTFMGGLPGMVIGGGLGTIAGPAIVQLLVALLLAILIIRLFFMFLAAYVQIILRLILGPIQIALGVLPGADGFGGWIRAIIAQLSVFATAGTLFMLATVFAIISEGSGGSAAMWKAPYLPGLGGTQNVSALFSIGILMLIPTVVKQIQQTIIGQHGSELPLGGAIMGGFSGVTALGMQGFHLWQQEHHTRAIQESVRNAATGSKGEDPHNAPK